MADNLHAVGSPSFPLPSLSLLTFSYSTRIHRGPAPFPQFPSFPLSLSFVSTTHSFALSTTSLPQDTHSPCIFASLPLLQPRPTPTLRDLHKPLYESPDHSLPDSITTRPLSQIRIDPRGLTSRYLWLPLTGPELLLPTVSCTAHLSSASHFETRNIPHRRPPPSRLQVGNSASFLYPRSLHRRDA